MAQLKMYWKNDGTESPCLRFPTGITINTLPEVSNGLGIWQDVIRYMSKNYDVDTGGDYYECAMLRKPNYNENMCYIFSVDGEAAATVPVRGEFDPEGPEVFRFSLLIGLAEVAGV